MLVHGLTSFDASYFGSGEPQEHVHIETSSRGRGEPQLVHGLTSFETSSHSSGEPQRVSPWTNIMFVVNALINKQCSAFRV